MSSRYRNRDVYITSNYSLEFRVQCNESYVGDAYNFLDVVTIHIIM